MKCDIAMSSQKVFKTAQQDKNILESIFMGISPKLKARTISKMKMGLAYAEKQSCSSIAID